MNFAEPTFLYLLAPLAAICIIWLIIVVLGLFSRSEKTHGSKYPLVGKVKLWGLFVLPSAALMIVALARPSMSGTSVKPSSGDIQVVVLFDNSFSMKADDIKPSRIEVAKREILSLDSFLKEGDRIGLFTFGKDSDRRLYLTNDFGTFFGQVSEMGSFENIYNETFFDTDFATALEHIYRSMDRQDASLEGRQYNQRYKPSKRSNRIVIIFSDGEDQLLVSKPENKDDADAKAKYVKKRSQVISEYRERGLKIYPVGIGTRNGVKWTSLLKGYKKLKYPEQNYLDIFLKVLEKDWVGQVTRLERNNLADLAKSTGVELSSYDWTVENSQGNVRQYLGYIISSNRRPLLEISQDDDIQQLWQYCLLVAVGFLLVGTASYPFSGFLRKNRF